MNEAGLALLREFEGFRMKAYPDPATGGAPWTIGYGHTGQDVHRGLTISQAQADALLNGDLERFEKQVRKLCDGVPTTENQHAAMVCLAYNVGVGNFSRSSVLRHHRDGHHEAAASAFALWNKASGKVMAGLTRRRAAESKLYLTP